MSKSVNRKNNCTVHFMVNEEDMNELNRRFAMTNFKSKREFYRESFIETVFSRIGSLALIHPVSFEKN